MSLLMRSNWEIHGRVPCRAWQADRMQDVRGAGVRHCSAMLRAVKNTQYVRETTRLQPAALLMLFTYTCNIVNGLFYISYYLPYGCATRKPDILCLT